MSESKKFKFSSDFYRRDKILKKSNDYISNLNKNSECELSAEVNDSIELRSELILSGSDEELSEEIEFTGKKIINSSGLRQKLKEWALLHNETHISINYLLNILREHGFHYLPKDARTLLKTPKQIKITSLGNGQFWYHGIENNLKSVLSDIAKNCTLSLKVNVDGISPFKSSNKEFWPILFTIDGEFNATPMVASLYYGQGKPPLQEFLAPFVNEVNKLIKKGTNIYGHVIKIQIKCWICDTPARSFIKGTASFNSEYGACIKCNVIGEYDKQGRHMSFPNLDAPLRTDKSFRLKSDKKHHKIDTPLTDLPMDMVQDVIVADFLHLLHLGVMKKLLSGWCFGNFNYRTKLRSSDIQMLNENLEKCNNTRPIEIHRSIRGISQLRHWKGSEFRTLLLYTGIVVFKNLIPAQVFDNFVHLFCACFILSSEYFSNYFPMADELIRDFLVGFQQIYGKDAVSSNFHNLIHVVSDVRKFGPLPNISSYQFENFLGFMTSLLRHGENPLAQLSNRIMEMSGVKKSCIIKNYPILEDKLCDSIYKSIVIRQNFKLKGDLKNNWFLTHNNEIVSMISAASNNGEYFILGEEIANKFPYFSLPIPSSLLFIYAARRNFKPAKQYHLSCIKAKFYSIKLEEITVFIPLLHTLT